MRDGAHSGGNAEASELAPLSVGQRVFVHFNRWTPDGWVPVRAEATVINPCVTGDGVYDGDVEYKTPGTLIREFSPRHNVEVVDDHG